MRILVVDDDPIAGELIVAMLEDAGHATVLAENGVEAADTLSSDSSIELVISDNNMPLVTGIDLFCSLRDDGIGTPFILLTGDDPERMRAEEPRLDACLSKSTGLEEALAEAIATILSRHG